MWSFIKTELDKRHAHPLKESEIPGSERRRMARINLILTIHCTLEGHSEQFQIMTENVNVLGIKFISMQQLERDSILNLRILLQSQSSPLLAKGKVAWCKEMHGNGRKFYEGGLEFLPLPDEDRIFFQKFIDMHVVSTYETPEEKEGRP
jgi:hypothetical protein